MSKISKEYSVVVGRTTIRNVKPEDQDDYFLIEEGDLNGGRTVIASVHVSPKKSYQTFDHIKTEISIPTDQPFVSPGVLLDTALAAIEAGEDAHYGALYLERLGPSMLELLDRKSNMTGIAEGDKTPELLLRILKENKEDPYITNILNAAKVLCASGHRDCTYMTQYSSGTTSWEREGDENGDWYKSIIVRPDGTFETYETYESK